MKKRKQKYIQYSFNTHSSRLQLLVVDVLYEPAKVRSVPVIKLVTELSGIRFYSSESGEIL